MATLRDLVTDALRESNIIAVGAQAPAAELDEGFRRLQIIIKGLFGNIVGESMRSLSYGDYGLVNSFARREDMSSYIDSVYAPKNARLVCNIDAPSTVYLDPSPQDGSRFAVIDTASTFDTSNLTLDANGRHIEDASSVTLSTAGLNREWFYRADQGNWVRVTDLTLDDESPFPGEFDDLLILSLAKRTNPRFGIDTKFETIEILRELNRNFRARYRQKVEADVDVALLRMSSPSHSHESDNEFE